LVAGKPPKKRVGVEQQAHGLKIRRTSIPGVQLFSWQRLEKLGAYRHLALQRTEDALRFRGDRYQLDDGLSTARDDNLLARLDACNQSGQMSLRNMN